jgi:hypothetical protein
MKGECRILRRGATVEASQGVNVDVSSWRERGGQRWLCIVLGQHTDPHGIHHGAVEIYVPVDVFEQRNGTEVDGPGRAYVSR